MNNSGIYQIRNKKNNKKYIGSAKNLNERKYYHFYYLNKNIHHNIHLQRSWNRYGKENFIFEPLFICSEEELIYWEQLLLDNLTPEYNILLVANSQLGVKHSSKTRRRISRSRKGMKLSKNHKRKIGEALKGNKNACKKEII